MACDNYYRKRNCPEAYKDRPGYVQQQGEPYFKDDRELLAYLMELERQHEEPQQPRRRVGQRR